MDLKEIMFGYVEWMYIPQHNSQWLVHVSTLMELVFSVRWGIDQLIYHQLVCRTVVLPGKDPPVLMDRMGCQCGAQMLSLL
jgi:hypothetical protein